MTTIEGGMVSTCDEDLHDLMRIKRSHGMARELPQGKFEAAIAANPNVDPRFMFLTDGYNFRNDEISAVLGLSQLKRLDQNIWIRRRNYRWFLEVLREKEEHFHVPTGAAGNSNFAFPLVPREKKVADALKLELERNGIESRPVVSGNLLLQPFVAHIQPERGSYRNINIVHENGVYVGNNHLIDNREIDLLSGVIDTAVRRAWTS
jgi:CDP-6-deoxy-D-xylo-4-hexulose-3-dehydrase